MVREIKNKNIFKRIGEIDKEVLTSYLFFLALIVTSAVTFALVKQQIEIRERAQGNGADIILSFDKKEATPGQMLTMDVSVDTHQVPISEVQFNFSYPQQKANPKIQYDNSVFQTSNEELVESGIIRFARSTQKAQAGKIHVGKVQFAALSQINATEISRLPNSSVKSLGNENIPTFVVTQVGENQKTAKNGIFDGLWNLIRKILPNF